jgi:CelD/BcsL family acetyltransferase involved in cellulose biosynthesis
MHVERITNWPELEALEHDWNALVEGPPFRSWDWLATWWKHYGTESQESNNRRTQLGGRRLNVLAVYDVVADDAGSARQLIGVAPWYLDENPVMGSALRWLGDGEICTDHLSLVCKPEDASRVATAVAEALTTVHDDWDRIDLKAVDADDAAVGQLLAAFEERECVVTQSAADACWAVELPATWDEYLAAISKSHRKQLRQLERRVLDSDRVRWYPVQNAAELDAAWTVLVDLHQRRRKSLGEPGCFASRSFFSFHREIVDRMFARGELRMSWLALDGRPAAAEYHFADSRATYAYQGGVDPDRLDEEPGRLSTILCMQQAIKEGHTKLDFLRGDEPYKAHWRATPQETFDYRVVPNRRLAKLRGRVFNVAGALTDLARQGAQLVTFASGSMS